MKKLMILLFALSTCSVFAQDKEVDLLDVSLTEAQAEAYRGIAVMLDNQRLQQEVQAWKVIARSGGGATVSHTTAPEVEGNIITRNPKTSISIIVGIIAGIAAIGENNDWFKDDDSGGSSDAGASDPNGGGNSNSAGDDQYIFNINNSDVDELHIDSHNDSGGE